MVFFCSRVFSSAGAASWPRVGRLRGGGVPDILGLLLLLGDGECLLRVPDLLRRLEDVDILLRWPGLLARHGNGVHLPSPLPGCSCEGISGTSCRHHKVC